MRMEQGAYCLEVAGAWLVFWSSQGARSSPQKLAEPRLGPRQPRGVRAGPVAGWGDSKYPWSTSVRPWARDGSQVGSQAGARQDRALPCGNLHLVGGRIGSRSMVGWVPCGPSSGPAWSLAPPGVHEPCPAGFLSHPLSQVFFPGVAGERRPPLARRVANAL